MNNIDYNNKTTISGEILSKPIFSHEIYGENFYEFFIKVMRLSNSFDIIPVTISERMMELSKLEIGIKIKCSGQFRSYNKIEDDKSKLMLTLFVRDIEILEKELDEDVNVIEVVGFICKEPIYRTTPFNREICDVLVAVNRNFGKSDYIPCIAWGRNARFVKNFSVGTKIKIFGRIQSREYQKKYDEKVLSKIAYEVSLSKVIPCKDDVVAENYVDFKKLKNNYAY